VREGKREEGSWKMRKREKGKRKERGRKEEGERKERRRKDEGERKEREGEGEA
jgi:hypothetical protein